MLVPVNLLRVAGLATFVVIGAAWSWLFSQAARAPSTKNNQA
jgi:hypothetical protein